MPKLIIRRQQQQAQYYTEELGSDFALDMMSIPGGTFMMGTPEQEIERLCKEYDADYFKRESLQHKVTVPSFFMGKYPVTQAQ
jgi:formylglycine-generating enzyme required for sulfatase activity